MADERDQAAPATEAPRLSDNDFRLVDALAGAGAAAAEQALRRLPAGHPARAHLDTATALTSGLLEIPIGQDAAADSTTRGSRG